MSNKKNEIVESRSNELLKDEIKTQLRDYAIDCAYSSKKPVMNIVSICLDHIINAIIDQLAS